MWTRIAARQAGLIARSQLVAAEVPPGTVDLWVAAGRLQTTPTQGIYRVAGTPETPQASAWFAALATRSVVSYTTAAQWWGDMPVADDRLVHVTRLDRRRLDWPPGIRVHRVGLDRGEIVRHRGLWVTSRAETVLDCIGWLSPGRALVLADRAVQQGWVLPGDFERRLERQRWGNKQVRRIGGQVSRGADAESERRLHSLLRRAGIANWVAQFPFVSASGRFAIDIAFPAQRLAVEVDGYAYHSSDDRFQRDRTKQNALIAAGWRVLRFTWVDITDHPKRVVATLLTVLAA